MVSRFWEICKVNFFVDYDDSFHTLVQAEKIRHLNDLLLRLKQFVNQLHDDNNVVYKIF